MPLYLSYNIQKMDADLSVIQGQLPVILYLTVPLLLLLAILLLFPHAVPDLSSSLIHLEISVFLFHKNTPTFPHSFL